MKIVSWNVNGLRSTEKPFLEFIAKKNPDILMIQELRAHPDLLNLFLKVVPGYKVLFNPAKRPGYSGTAVYYTDRLNIESITSKLDSQILSSEGRTIELTLNDIKILNFYTPNGTGKEERLAFKLKFYKEITNYIKELLKSGFSIVIGGDLNVAATELDLYAPKENQNRSGFLPKERIWFKEFLQLGFIDTFRLFEKQGGFYTWWHMRDPKRKKNRGWRFDYFLISKNLKYRIKGSKILKNVFGSDHCPIELSLNF
ncbi:MAG: exodeoxyribonuclease III [Candidatus Dojkabacteria bacterium]|jgi:exodeoxyribonuclease-3|nr:exodeoxyribonuclease III [Candidatus Dojkabacteria bacterium]